MKKRVLLFIVLAFTSYSFSQTQKVFWKSSTKKSESITYENKLPINNPTIYELDFNALKEQLSTSPNRFLRAKSNVIAGFPNENGQIEHFRIYESSNMDPQLAANYPEIKSYLGQGIENPTAKLYFSMSPLGFQSMKINADQSAVFIEPYTTDLQSYVVYKKSDKVANLNNFECRVIDVANVGINNASTARPNADDGVLRTYRLALSVTGEYTTYFGGTKPLALAAMNNTMTRVNGVFEIDFGVHMNLIANNDLIIYTNASTDPYSAAASGAGGAWNSELQTNLTSVIGNANYDIGHLFGASGGGGNAGCIACVCKNPTGSVPLGKGSGFTSPADGIPAGDNFDIDYVAHEMGHQFGGNHTFSMNNEGTGVNVEPGSGSTIMGYAGITNQDVQPHSDALFHAVSIQQITNYIKTTTCQTNTSTGNTTPTANAGADYTIPKSTPFMLTGSGTDANGDSLSYIWEQMDNAASTATGANSAATATRTSGPTFRSYDVSSSPTRYFPRMQSVLNGATTTAGTEINVEALSSVARTLNFRFTVRDNRVTGPANNSDDAVITVNATAGPFAVTSPNTAVSYIGNTSQTITWSVAGTTANGVNCANVDILLSTDGGTTFPITLLASTPNDGTQVVTIPNLIGTTNRIMIKGTNHIFFDVSNTNFTITNGIADTTPPTPPTLTASNTTPTSTDLSWSGATDNIGVTGYNIYQDATLIGTTTTSTYNVIGLTPNTNYTFNVVAFDASSNVSSQSNTVNITTLPPDLTPPTPPTLSAGLVTSSTTSLSWTGATDNIGVTAYNVYQNAVLIATVSTTTYIASGLTALTSYSFTVNAVDAAGNVSTLSNTVTVTTPISYCASQGNIVTDELIGNVTLGSINNTSTGGTGYTDFTSISTNLTLGTSNTISITPTWTAASYNEGYAVFIDYNHNGDFTDAGETVWTKAASTTTPVTGTFVIPLTATTGNTRMRVSMKYNGIPTSCEIFSYGQVEDYTVNIIPSNTIISAKLFIQGYYDTSSHQMLSVNANQGVGSSTTDVDNVTLELRDATTLALATTTTAMLQTNGMAIGTFNTAISGSFYLVIKHRNALETWSANPLTISQSTPLYDFTTSSTQAYESNLKELESGVFAIYSGDLDNDGFIDIPDYTNWETDYNFGAVGVFSTDLDGDGFVDIPDYSIWEENYNNAVFAKYPVAP